MTREGFDFKWTCGTEAVLHLSSERDQMAAASGSSHLPHYYCCHDWDAWEKSWVSWCTWEARAPRSRYERQHYQEWHYCLCLGLRAGRLVHNCFGARQQKGSLLTPSWGGLPDKNAVHKKVSIWEMRTKVSWHEMQTRLKHRRAVTLKLRTLELELMSSCIRATVTACLVCC